MSQNLFTCCLIMLMIVMAGCSLSQAVITTQPQFHSNHKRQSSKSREMSFFMITSDTWRSRCFPVSPKATLLPSFCSSVVKFPKKMTSAANLFLLVAFKTFCISWFLGYFFFRILSWRHKLGESHVDGKLLQVLQFLVDQDGDQETLGHLQLVLCRMKPFSKNG